MKSFTISEINKVIQGEVFGNTSHEITAPEQLEKAETDHITFIGNRKYAKLWEKLRMPIWQWLNY